MKIKNFKLNKGITTKLATYILVSSLTASTLTGCSNDSLLEDTLLEKTIVVTFIDGSKDIVVPVEVCRNGEANHYRSIISGSYISDKECEHRTYGTRGYINHYEITSLESITKYLTSEQLKKAMNGELTNEDIVGIVTKTIEPITETNDVVK